MEEDSTMRIEKISEAADLKDEGDPGAGEEITTGLMIADALQLADPSLDLVLGSIGENNRLYYWKIMLN